VPDGSTPETAGALTDSLSAADAIADELPVGALPSAQHAFTTGLNTASLVAGAAIAAAATLCVIALRHVRPLGQDEHICQEL
jgi:MFS transporter, DHA2 family, multidrug resistance protein